MESSNYKVTCRDCKRKVPAELVESISRYGGGNYRRGGRWFLGQSCVSCIESALLYLEVRDGKPSSFHNLSGYSVNGALHALSRFISSGASDLDEERWRAMFPDNRHITFEVFFDGLRFGVNQYNVVGH